MGIDLGDQSGIPTQLPSRPQAKAAELLQQSGRTDTALGIRRVTPRMLSMKHRVCRAVHRASACPVGDEKRSINRYQHAPGLRQPGPETVHQLIITVRIVKVHNTRARAGSMKGADPVRAPVTPGEIDPDQHHGAS